MSRRIKPPKSNYLFPYHINEYKAPIWLSSDPAVRTIGQTPFIHVPPLIDLCEKFGPEFVSIASSIGQFLVSLDEYEEPETTEEPAEGIMGAISSGFGFIKSLTITPVLQTIQAAVKGQIIQRIFSGWRILRAQAKKQQLTIDDFTTLVKENVPLSYKDSIYRKEFRLSMKAFLEAFLKLLKFEEIPLDLKLFLILFDNEEAVKTVFEILCTEKTCFTHEELAIRYKLLFLDIPDDTESLIEVHSFKLTQESDFCYLRYDPQFMDFNNLPVLYPSGSPTQEVSLYQSFHSNKKTSTHTATHKNKVVIEFIRKNIKYGCANHVGVSRRSDSVFLSFSRILPTPKWNPKNDLNSTYDCIRSIFDLAEQFRSDDPHPISFCVVVPVDLNREFSYPPPSNPFPIPLDNLASILYSSKSTVNEFLKLRLVCKSFNLAMKSLLPTRQIIVLEDSVSFGRYFLLQEQLSEAVVIESDRDIKDFGEKRWFVCTKLAWSGDVLYFGSFARVDDGVKSCLLQGKEIPKLPGKGGPKIVDQYTYSQEGGQEHSVAVVLP